MKRYYTIYPIKDKYHAAFDTIEYVAERVGIPIHIFINKYFGCSNEMDLFFGLCCKQIIHPFFNSSRYIAGRLNKVLEEHNIPLRISQEGAYVRMRHDSKH